jgi:mono/diheme cytochrome c family protein
MKIIKATLLALGAVTFIGMLSFISPPAQAGGDELAEARQTYDKMCASCHGKDGSGNTATGKKLNVRPFSHPDVKAMSDQQLFDVTAKGEGKMPGYAKKLTEAQIRDQVKLVRVLGTN